MEEKDPQFYTLIPKQRDHLQSYELGLNCLWRRLFFLHTMKCLRKLKKRQKEIDNRAIGEKIETNDIPDIKTEDDVVLVSQKGILITDKAKFQQFTVSGLFGLLLRQFPGSILFFMVLYGIEIACRLGFSIILLILLELVTKDLNWEMRRNAYLLALSCGALLLVGRVSRHNAFYEIPILTGKIRSELIFIIYKQLSKISVYSSKSQELGRIINMLSNDLNTIETKSLIFFAAFITPFALAGILAILITRLGWTGILIFVVIVVVTPIQICVGKLNGHLLEKVNINKDKRVRTTSEVIEGIKFIKLYGWQFAFKRMVEQIRKKQIGGYMKLSIGRALERALGNYSPLIAGLVCFLVMHFTEQGKELTIANIFSTLELMATVRLLVFQMGIAIGFYFELKVIFQRLANIYNLEDIRMKKVDVQKNITIQLQDHFPMDSGNQLANKHHQDHGQDILTGEIIFQNFNGYWKKEDFSNPTLKNVNLHFLPKALYGITGNVGSGKSTLLAVILQQIPYYTGSFSKNGNIAYVEQEPVIFSTTVKNNVIFGADYNQQRYEQCLEDSCLVSDLSLFQNGEETLAGQRGTTLSGGQKARISLARALYADADIYLLDDPLSAVDPKVARQIFTTVQKLSVKKTVVLVTHQISYLYECKKVIMIEEGRITHEGSPDALRQYLLARQNEPCHQKAIGHHQQVQTGNIIQKQENVHTETHLAPPKQSINGEGEKIEVTWRTYPKYILYSNTNRALFPITIFFFLAAEAVYTTYFRLLAQYDNLKSGKLTNFSSDRHYWLTLGLLQLSFFTLINFKYFFLNIVVLTSNKAIHHDMIEALVRSPNSFFNITPSGRLANNFSNDLGVMDNLLAFILTDCIEGPIICCIMLGNVVEINLWFLPLAVVNIVFLIVFFLYCKSVILNAKQLDLRMKNPIFQKVREMISGLTQIRILHQRSCLMKDFAHALNQSLRANICFWNLSRTFGAYLNFFAIIIVTVGWIIGIVNVTPQTAGLYSVSVIFLLQISDYLQSFFRQLILLSSFMVSAERVFKVASLPSQKALKTEYDFTHMEIQESCSRVNENRWPRLPCIKLKNLKMKYQQNLPYVLKDLNIQINAYQKVGIVGRTGAGKSSIIQALMRISEPEQDSIYRIGHHNALKMGLHSLRHHITVIPQIPFIFRGTIRANIDPLEERKDDEIWKVLEETHLKVKIQQLHQKLDTYLASPSQFFSIGQKQLLCLARALLQNNKFLILDQATANVDYQTDKFIHNIIQNKFKNTTIITIAHRLTTVADCDQIIVMERGSIGEKGSPWQLIQNKGLFYQMAKNTGSTFQIIADMAKARSQKINKKQSVS